MKRLILLITGVMVAFFGSSTDRFYIEDFTIRAGETRTVSILLDNEAEYTAFQGDLQLASGLSTDEDSFDLTERKNANHTLTVSEFPNNIYRMLSYSVKLKPYNGNSGALVTFSITASQDFTGPTVIALRDVIFTTTEGIEVTLEDQECQVYLTGDVNGDGSISVGDVTMLIGIVLGGGNSSPAADVNGDGSITVSDVTALISMVLRGD